MSVPRADKPLDKADDEHAAANDTLLKTRWEGMLAEKARQARWSSRSLAQREKDDDESHEGAEPGERKRDYEGQDQQDDEQIKAESLGASQEVIQRHALCRRVIGQDFR